MSEFHPSFVTPPKQDFDTVGFQGSMQQILQENIGNYVIVDFLTGTDNLISKQGILYNVSSQFLVLYDDINLRYVVCDIFTVKFVTFLLPGYRPGQVPSSVLASEEESVREENNLPSLTGNTTPVEAAQQPADDDTAPVVTADTTAQGVIRQEQANVASAMLPEAVTVAAMTPAQAAYQYAVRRRM